MLKGDEFRSWALPWMSWWSGEVSNRDSPCESKKVKQLQLLMALDILSTRLQVL